jgi:KaiC/GvpD/RAD55 family RecA-like ATPase
MKKQNSAPKGKPRANDESPLAKVVIRKMPTGVRGLDDILGGGIPEFSFNVIAGTPGCGKTTLAHQIVFANATGKNPAIYFTVLGEPAMKMLRYQQQYSFFDEQKLGKAVRFINLADIVLEQDLNAVLEEIIKQVTAINPAIVVVDSFRTVVRKAMTSASELEMQSFIQRLAQFLTSWQATTFLVGEYSHEEMRDNPLFTLAGDGEKFGRAEIAGHQNPRAGVGAGIAYNSHQRSRRASVFAHAGIGRQQNVCVAAPAPFHRYSRTRHNARRRPSRRRQPARRRAFRDG